MHACWCRHGGCRVASSRSFPPDERASPKSVKGSGAGAAQFGRSRGRLQAAGDALVGIGTRRLLRRPSHLALPTTAPLGPPACRTLPLPCFLLISFSRARTSGFCPRTIFNTVRDALLYNTSAVHGACGLQCPACGMVLLPARAAIATSHPQARLGQGALCPLPVLLHPLL